MTLNERSWVKFDCVFRIHIPTFLSKVHYNRPCRDNTKIDTSIFRVRPLFCPWRKGQRSNLIMYSGSSCPLSYLRYIVTNHLATILKELEAYLEFDLWPFPDPELKVTGGCQSNLSEIFSPIHSLQSLKFNANFLFLGMNLLILGKYVHFQP